MANLSSAEQCKRLIAAKYPLVYLLSWEERRVESILKKIAESGFSTPFKFYVWSITDGLVFEGKSMPDSKDPVKALDFVMRSPDAAVFVFRDFHAFLNDNHPEILRKLRDIFHVNKSQFKSLFIVSPLLRIPIVLSKEITMLDFDLPSKKEMEGMLEAVIQANKSLTTPLPDDVKALLVQGCMGLTLDEGRAAMTKSVMGKAAIALTDVHQVFEEKKNLVKKEGILEFIDLGNFSLSELGGLDNLKEWLNLRARFFTKEAEDFGINAPKGMLLTGIPGCGKSICVKAVAAHWHLPLFRLDMDRIYGTGAPEDALRKAFKTVEAAAPAILWIDEIEKGVAGYSGGGGGSGGGEEARVFGMFLTWMQDKKQDVFVAATANEVDKLPPEILRKGRFDEIFFVDLPNDTERAEIFTIHLKAHKQDVERFDLKMLAKGTNGFTGSEIEQVVMAGLYEAFAQKRELTNNDLHKAAGRMVALSVTMAERIKDLKRWAQYRAVKATKSAQL